MGAIGEHLALPDREFGFDFLDNLAQHLEGSTSMSTARSRCKRDIADLQWSVAMDCRDAHIGICSRNAVKDLPHDPAGIGMNLVFEFDHDFAVVVVADNSKELDDRSVLISRNMSTQNVEFDDRLRHDGERGMHAMSLPRVDSVRLLSVSLRNEMRDDRKEHLHGFLHCLHRARQVHEQGLLVESDEAAADCGHRGGANAVGP